MNTFCAYIQDEIKKHFKIEVDVFVSKKKMLVHFSFEKPLLAYPFFQDVIELVSLRWNKRKLFFDNCEMIYPKLNQSMRYKSDYTFFKRIKNEKKKESVR